MPFIVSGYSSLRRNQFLELPPTLTVRQDVIQISSTRQVTIELMLYSSQYATFYAVFFFLSLDSTIWEIRSSSWSNCDRFCTQNSTRCNVLKQCNDVIWYKRPVAKTLAYSFRNCFWIRDEIYVLRVQQPTNPDLSFFIAVFLFAIFQKSNNHQLLFFSYFLPKSRTRLWCYEYKRNTAIWGNRRDLIVVFLQRSTQ